MSFLTSILFLKQLKPKAFAGFAKKQKIIIPFPDISYATILFENDISIRCNKRDTQEYITRTILKIAFLRKEKGGLIL